MKIFVISIPRSTERFAYIRRHLLRTTKFDWEIIGIDGRELKDSTKEWLHTPDLTASQVGCALSHATACKRIDELGLSWALIVEDDVCLPKDIDSILDRIENEIRPGEVISLYNRTIKVERFSSQNCVPIYDRHLIYPFEARVMRTAAAYVIERTAARNIAEFNIPVVKVADNWSFFHQHGVVNTMRLLHPIPCKLVPFESTLAYDRDTGILRVAKMVANFAPFSGRLRTLRRQWIESKRERNLVLVNEPSALANFLLDRRRGG